MFILIACDRAATASSEQHSIDRYQSRHNVHWDTQQSGHLSGLCVVHIPPCSGEDGTEDVGKHKRNTFVDPNVWEWSLALSAMEIAARLSGEHILTPLDLLGLQS